MNLLPVYVSTTIVKLKVFASIAKRRGGCATAERARLSVWNVAAYDGRISVLIWLGDTDGGSIQGQIDLLGFTWG